MNETHTLTIAREIKERFNSHTTNEYPNEACGMLVGYDENNNYKIVDFIPMDSTLKSPVQFVMDSNEILAAYRTAADRNLKIVGIFHSHPMSPPIPSITDKTYMETNTGVWIIQSGVDYKMRSYLLRNDSIIEVDTVFE